MKISILLPLLLAVSTCTTSISAQNKKAGEPKRASPTVTSKQTMAGGTTVTIIYGQPSVKGRKIGTDLEPMDGQIWRAGANEATVFEVSKPVTIEGKPLAAGKYAFFTIKNGNNWTLIFNKTWKTWGAYEYEKNKGEDALQVTVAGSQAAPASEKLTYKLGKDGSVQMLWGPHKVAFKVAESKLAAPIE